MGSRKKYEITRLYMRMRCCSAAAPFVPLALLPSFAHFSFLLFSTSFICDDC